MESRSVWYSQQCKACTTSLSLCQTDGAEQLWSPWMNKNPHQSKLWLFDFLIQTGICGRAVSPGRLMVPRARNEKWQPERIQSSLKNAWSGWAEQQVAQIVKCLNQRLQLFGCSAVLTAGSAARLVHFFSFLQRRQLRISMEKQYIHIYILCARFCPDASKRTRKFSHMWTTAARSHLLTVKWVRTVNRDLKEEGSRMLDLARGVGDC